MPGMLAPVNPMEKQPVRELNLIGHKVAARFGRSGAITILVAVLLSTAACGSSTPTPSPSPAVSPSATLTPTDSPSPTPTETATPLPSGLTQLPSGWAYSDLDGTAATTDAAHRLPMAIMVDDNAAARPQAGFTGASIVWQAPADGGEDRYMLIFQEEPATDIGPVRSARPYYIEWAAEWRASYGHYGGDATALGTTIPAMAKYIYNMDALNGQPCAYHRVDNRAAPHNAFTNTDAQVTCLSKYGYPLTYKGPAGYTFIDDTPSATRPASESISIPYHTGPVSYTYDPTSDMYLRLVSGAAQIDAGSKKQVTARNIVVLFQPLSYDSKVDPGHNRPVIANVGSGKAVVFKEGKAIAATWKKTSTSAVTRLYDASGAEIPFVRGQIFMQSVPVGTAVTY